MIVELSVREVSAVRRLLMAEPHPDTVLSAETLDALARVVPCDLIGVGQSDADGYVLRGLELPLGVNDDLGPKPCEDGDYYTGIVQVAALPANDSDIAFFRKRGIRDNVWIGFRTDAGAVAQLFLSRRTAFFNERDLALLAMLEPALGRLLTARPTVPSAPLLTATERRVLELVSSGASNREAAEALFVTVATVRKHLENSYRKLGVRNRTGAVAALRTSA